MRRQQNFRIKEHGENSSNQRVRRIVFKNVHDKTRMDKGRLARRNKLLSFFNDAEDVEMLGVDLQKLNLEKRNYFNDQARSAGKRHGGLKPADWYFVKIIYGAKYDKNTILELILKYLSPHAFTPISYTVTDLHASFYVDELTTAQMLEGANRKILLPDGRKMMLKISEERAPRIAVTPTIKEKLKFVMSKRYISENKALDLSKLSKDPEFGPELCVTMASFSVLRAVLQIITENIPDLFALDLTGNKIQCFDEASSAELRKLKNLSILHLGNNNIRHFGALNSLRGLELKELVLKDNPINGPFSDRTHFVSEIRKRFRKLVKLDDVELPPVVSFDVGEEAKLPTPQALFVCNPEAKPIAVEFLTQYFALYDSDKRNELIQAYHDNSCFSQCTYYTNMGGTSSNNSKLSAYIQESRNLLKVSYGPKRIARLHMGKENIVKYLEKLPKTQHDLKSFVVDLPTFTPNFMTMCVSGVFREPNPSTPEANWLVRHFSRTFLIVPVGQGFCIVNDSLVITNATDQEQAVFFKVETPTPPAIESPSSSQPMPVPSAPIDDAVRLQMVQTLASQSGMNLEWSKKCLDETQWNFDRAFWTFTELQKRGTIPPEAFAK